MIRTTFRRMKRWFADPDTPIRKNIEILLTTGAKAYYLGGGWWRISGYAPNGEDIPKL